MIDLGDSEVYFEKFIKYANDFYNQRGTAEGIRRIFKLFDNQGIGSVTKADIERLASELDIFFKPEQLDKLFISAS